MNYIYKNLAEFGQELLKSPTLEQGMPLIAKYSKNVMGAQRCSIFIFDEKNNELWTTLADGIERIIIDSDQGIVGQVLQTAETMIVNTPKENPYFLPEIDKDSGFETKNLIATPIISSDNRVIGVLEMLNKQGGFKNEEEKFMRFFSNFISGFIELAPLHSRP